MNKKKKLTSCQCQGFNENISPSQTPAVHFYYAPFSFLALHPSLFFQVIILNQSTFSVVNLLNCIPTFPHVYPISNPIIFHPLIISSSFIISLIFSSAPLVTPHNFLSYAFIILSILLIPSKLLRMSIHAPLIQTFSFSLHTIVSLPYIKIGTRKLWCSTVLVSNGYLLEGHYNHTQVLNNFNVKQNERIGKYKNSFFFPPHSCYNNKMHNTIIQMTL